MKRLIKYENAIAIICMSICFLFPTITWADDLSGHWSELAVRQWISSGFASGYPDGTFRPDQGITRAEFITWMNRVVQKQNGTQIPFADVANSSWYAAEIKRASISGIIQDSGGGMFRPNDKITRLEATQFLANGLLSKSEGIIGSFSDTQGLSSNELLKIGTVVNAEIMNGYPDGNFRPYGTLTRSEAIITLERIRDYNGRQSTSSTEYSSNTDVKENYTIADPGIYGSESGSQTFYGDVEIKTGNVTLRNAQIKGSLIFQKGIGDGSITIENVTVQGKTLIKDGGRGVFKLSKSQLGHIQLFRTTGGTITLSSTDCKDMDISVLSNKEGEEVYLSGSYGKIDVENADSYIHLNPDAKVDDLSIASTADGTTLYIDENAVIKNLTLYVTMTVKGIGTIKSATVNADDVLFEMDPEELHVKGYAAPIVSASSSANITYFYVTNQVGDAIIDKTNKTVVAYVSAGTSLSELSPSIGVSYGATITPGSGTTRNFTSTLNYTVVARDGSTKKTWTVTIKTK